MRIARRLPLSLSAPRYPKVQSHRRESVAQLLRQAHAALRRFICTSSREIAAGLIIKDLPLVASNFRQSMTLQAYLVREGTVAIANIDTRQLTRQLRTQGAQNGCIFGLAAGETITQAVIDKAIAAAKAAPSMSGLDLAKVVTVKAPYPWTQTEWALSNPVQGGKPGYGIQEAPRFHVVACDFGVKKNILRMLSSRGCRVTVVPAQTSAADVLKLKPNASPISPVPSLFVAFTNDRSFDPYKGSPETSDVKWVGTFQTTQFGNTFAVNAYPDQGNGMAIVFKGYAGHFIRSNYPTTPLWLREGLAELYATFRI